jgi:hypothetical protein
LGLFLLEEEKGKEEKGSAVRLCVRMAEAAEQGGQQPPEGEQPNPGGDTGNYAQGGEGEQQENYPQDYAENGEDGGGDEMQEQEYPPSDYNNNYNNNDMNANDSNNFNDQNQGYQAPQYNNNNNDSNNFNNDQNQEFQQNKPAHEHSTFNVYVGGLNPSVDEQDLTTTFAACGEIASTRVFRDKNTGDHMVLYK